MRRGRDGGREFEERTTSLFTIACAPMNCEPSNESMLCSRCVMCEHEKKQGLSVGCHG